MSVSSTVWGGFIAVGSIVGAVGLVLAAIGNFYFSDARDREKAIAAGEKAMSMLKVECANNVDHIQTIQTAIAKGQLPGDDLETTAWSIVSSGGLLVQVDQDTLGRVADVYYLTELANKEIERLIDAKIAPLANSNVIVVLQQHYVSLKSILDRLEPKLKDLQKHFK